MKKLFYLVTLLSFFACQTKRQVVKTDVSDNKMHSLLYQISEKAIVLSDFEFEEQQKKAKWLGTDPASESDIMITEKRLGFELPLDYKMFLSVTNGFTAPLDVEPTFERIEKIDFLKNVDSYLIQIWSQGELKEIGEQLEQSIIIGGINEEQYFLLIPPNNDSSKWKYWKFSSWQPGEHQFNNLEHYFSEVLDFINEIIKS